MALVSVICYIFGWCVVIFGNKFNDPEELELIMVTNDHYDVWYLLRTMFRPAQLYTSGYPLTKFLYQW